MSIAGEKPETGVRIAIERAREGGPPWEYTGAAHLPEAQFPVRVTVAGDGTVDVQLVPVGPAEGGEGAAVAPPGDLAEKVRLIVRTSFRQASADGEPPARRIVRWRGEK